MAAAAQRTVSPRRRAGQFYTPPEVARFLLRLLDALPRPAGHPSPLAARRVVDPACGTGVFLDAAVELLAAPPRHVVGVDLHPHGDAAWTELGDAVARRIRGDGLLLPDEAGFDLVVGNPQYHGDSLRCLEALVRGGDEPTLARARALADALSTRYQLWQVTARQGRLRGQSPQLLIPGARAPRPDDRQLAQLARYPLELVFLERFVALCRPGGHVVIVMPEGIAANRRWQAARDWLLGRCQLRAVVRLPRGTFRASGTAAVTAALLLRRRESGDEGDESRALLLDVERLDRLDALLDAVRAGDAEAAR